MKIDIRELLYQITTELKKSVYSTLSSDRDILPNTIYFEPGSHCPNRCQDCYVPLEHRKQNIQLSEKAISQILNFAKDTNVPYLTVMGGDPFDDNIFDKTYQILSQNPSLRFIVCNDGTSLAQGDKLNKIQKLHNTSPVFSIDGFEKINNDIRGKGIFQKTIDGLQAYSDHGKHLCGGLVTIRPSNIQEVTSPDFLNFLVDKGCHYVAYSNVYTEKGGKYTLSTKEYTDRLIELMKISEKLPATVLTSHFGQITPHKVSLKERLHAISVDYNGNIFSSRRGESLGNINDSDTTFKDIVHGDKLKNIFNNKHRDLNFEAISHTDIRYNGFLNEVIARLEGKGVFVEKPK